MDQTIKQDRPANLLLFLLSVGAGRSRFATWYTSVVHAFNHSPCETYVARALQWMFIGRD
eukprot:1074838-Amphidinium_carterae.2